jgi:hypothetical protein
MVRNDFRDRHSTREKDREVEEKEASSPRPSVRLERESRRRTTALSTMDPEALVAVP